MPSGASTTFRELLRSVEQLIAIHRRVQTGRGRRHQQDAIHRAGVVMIVAAWQAYVQKVLAEALDAISADLNAAAPAAPGWAVHTFQMRRAVIETGIKKFNTPDDVKVRDLFRDSLNFNPWPSWEWRQGRRQWDANEVRRRTNTWVLVRHSVAHGFDLPADVDWLWDHNGNPHLTLGLLEECKSHFAHLVNRTDHAFATHLVANHGLQQPW